MTSSIHSSTPPLGCADVDARLADYLDDETPSALAADDRAAVDRHVASCARCRALLRDLDQIGEAAAALPALAPSRDLWADIAPRLAPRVTADDDAPRVLPFEVRHLRHAPPPARLRGSAPLGWSRRALAAAAVVLVAVSAGSTYLLTRAGASPDAAAHVAAGPATADQPGAPRVAASGPAADAPADPPGGASSTAGAPASDDPAGEVDTGPARGADRRDVGRRGDARLASRRDDAGIDLPAAAAYDREIAALRAAVRDRRGELDSATVNVLVRNLGIIDAAIAQSRAALARDPQSQFLGDQLTRALGQKVELLRTVALMPRT